MLFDAMMRKGPLSGSRARGPSGAVQSLVTIAPLRDARDPEKGLLSAQPCCVTSPLVVSVRWAAESAERRRMTHNHVADSSLP
jgi:hypothetical protein